LRLPPFAKRVTTRRASTLTLRLIRIVLILLTSLTTPIAVLLIAVDVLLLPRLLGLIGLTIALVLLAAMVGLVCHFGVSSFNQRTGSISYCYEKPMVYKRKVSIFTGKMKLSKACGRRLRRYGDQSMPLIAAPHRREHTSKGWSGRASWFTSRGTSSPACHRLTGWQERPLKPQPSPELWDWNAAGGKANQVAFPPTFGQPQAVKMSQYRCWNAKAS
jgi:hypothetical protein